MNDKSIYIKSFLPHGIAFIVFLIITLIYYSPVLEGKLMMQSDMIQMIGSLKESNDYKKNTGEEILWSNSTFSGMPVWRGHSTNVVGHVHQFLAKVFTVPVFISLVGYVGFYVLLWSFSLNPWLCFIGAFAYIFSSFNIISLEAGHINKILAMHLMAPVIAGITLTYRGKFLLGAGITTLFLSFHIYYNHIQISYYLLIVILLLTAAELYLAVKANKIPEFIKASLILVVCLVIALGPNLSRLWATAVYSKSTPRSGSELSSKKSQGNGLDKEYAFAWSNGIAETMTILIPSFHGGSSHENLGTKSNVYEALVQNGVPKKEAKDYSKGMPLYWGDQQFTSGPVYFGAIICLFFCIGLFLIRGPLKWWVVAATVVSIVLSWGKNFELVNDFFFYYVPMYNKFRSVTMILSIAQLTFPFFAFIVLQKIINRDFETKELNKAILNSFYIVGGLCLLFALFATSFFDFQSPNDAAYKGQFPEWLMAALKDDRISNFRMDAIRSFILVSLATGLLWMMLKEKIDLKLSFGILAVLVIFDLWVVDKRYLDDEDFKYRKNYESQIFVPSEANLEILKDPDPNFRVFNYTAGITSDAFTSYFHKSLGGYSAIKLNRYQDVIDSALSRGNKEVINMLNTKYFIGQDRTTGKLITQQNPEALGNAWFVESFKLVKNADEEITGLKNFRPEKEAIINVKFEDQLKGINPGKNENSKIEFISYHPHKMVYKSENSQQGIAVFSEIYYQPGWNAYIDGKLTPHMQVNYILRGLVVPAGKHEIVFKFEPEHYFIGEKISLVGSILLVLSIFGIFAFLFINKFKKQKLNA